MAQPLLTTASKVKDYLNTTVPEEQETVVKDYVQIASTLVRQYCRRRFTSPRLTETREFYTYGRHSVYVDEIFSDADVTSVADEYDIALNYDLDFSNEPVRKGAYLKVKPFLMEFGVRGVPGDHGDMFIRNLNGLSLSTIPEKVRVTGTFGYALGEIPRDIEFATRRTAALWFKEEIANYTEGAFISRGQQFVPDQLPAIVVGMLERSWKASDGAVLI